MSQTTGLLTLFFHDGPVGGYDGRQALRHRAPTAPSAARCSSAAIYLPPSQFEAWFPSLAHTDEHVERTLAAARRVARGGGGMSALAAGRRGRGPGAAPSTPRRTRARTASPSVVADEDRLFVLEAVYEGYLLHYGEPRAFRGMDADLRLLAGDALYALGLSRLAETGDLEAVAELSDLISLDRPGPGRGARPEDAESRLVGRAPERLSAADLVTPVAMLQLSFAARLNT